MFLAARWLCAGILVSSFVSDAGSLALVPGINHLCDLASRWLLLREAGGSASRAVSLRGGMAVLRGTGCHGLC